MPVLDFWFDFASTYSYIAAMRIGPLCRDNCVELRWKPFLLGPVFQLQGWNTSPFNLNQRRGEYMWRDIERLAAKFAIPYRKPSSFPRASTLPARVACSIAGEPWSAEFIRRVFQANFVHDLDINDESVVRDILRSCGQDERRIMREARSEPRRSLLRKNTETAIAEGIFGAPNCVVQGELFWGEETLEDAIAWLLARHRGGYNDAEKASIC